MIDKSPENQSKSAALASSSGQPGSPTTQAGTPAKKTRSPVERAVVWGGILLMVVLVGYQYYVNRCYRQTSDKLNVVLKEADTDADALNAVRLYDTTVKKMLVGNPKLAESRETKMDWTTSKVDTYTWSGPFKSYSLELHFGKAGSTERDAPEVLNIVEK
jgi:hypothetical protein